MAGIIRDVLADPDIMFIVVAALGLTMLTGVVAMFLPDRFCGGWLSIMAVVQLGLGLSLAWAAHALREGPAGDISYALMTFLSAPVVIGGLSAAFMRLGIWIFSRRDRREWP